MSPLKRSIWLPICALLAASPLVPGTARATCGAEGCPVVREGFGETPSRFAFDLRYQDVTQDKLWDGSNSTNLADVISGAEIHGEVELYTRTKSWVAEGRARITDRLRVSATLPYVEREHRHWLNHSPTYDPRFLNAWKYEGLADATVLTQFRVLQVRGLPTLTAQGGVKLPTGRRHVDNEVQDNFGYESALEPSARPGTGSTDWLAGAVASQALPWQRALPITASVLARWNSKGTDDYKVGNELQAGLSGGYAALSWLTVLGQVNFSRHGSDVSAEASEGAHSAMRSLFLTPGVTARIAPALRAYGMYQVRAWGRSDEATVVATNHFLLGMTYSIGY